MPQRPKPDTRARFLRAARARFLARGFRETSLRAVAADAGGTLGNLRNYFPNKDALFEAACAPVPSDVREALAGQGAWPVPQTLEALVRTDEVSVEAVASYILEHRAPLELLLVCSGGSSLEGWVSELFEAYVALEQERLAALERAQPAWWCVRPPERIVRALCRMYFELACDLVRGDLEVPEFRDALEAYDAFRRAGSAIYFREDV